MARGLGKRLVIVLREEEGVHLFADDLLFKHRAQDDSGSAVIFELSGRIKIIGKRPGADDQRVRQAKSQIGRGEIHFSSLPFWLSGDSSSRSLSKATLMPASC